MLLPETSGKNYLQEALRTRINTGFLFLSFVAVVAWWWGAQEEGRGFVTGVMKWSSWP
jgi:hypothetical protein